MHQFEQMAQTTMNSTPKAWKELELSKFCTGHLAHYVEKESELEKLIIQCNAFPLQGSRRVQYMLDLTQLHCLTELAMQMQNDVCGNLFSAIVKACLD